MSFIVKKTDGAGLESRASKLGNQGSAAVANFSARSLADESLHGNIVSANPVTYAVEVAAEIQVGMSSKPKM